MPKNCSSDLAAVVDHIDDVVSTGTPKEVKELKTKFGLPDLADDDFGGALLWPLLRWQRIIPGQPERQADDFHEFCDRIEADDASPSTDDARGVGMDKALENLEKEFRNSIAPKLLNSGLFPSSNPQLPMFTDTSILNEFNRAWVWMLCNELGWFQGRGLFQSECHPLPTDDWLSFSLVSRPLPSFSRRSQKHVFDRHQSRRPRLF